MEANLEKVKALAPDLRDGKAFPRSPREMVGGYVLAARALDKCRADIVGQAGEYHANCGLDRHWFEFTEIDYDEFRSYVATGADDDEVAAWIAEHAKKCERAQIVIWNNKQRDTRLSDLPPETQVYMEDYVREYLPPGTVIHQWFDVYDIEEGRM